MADAHWTALGAFWIGIAATAVALVAALVNYFFFRSHIDPAVIVYATADEARPSIINLVIENIGKGLAKDVSFEFSEPIPQRAFGIENAPMPARMSRGPLITGIPALGPGARRVITWGQYGGLHRALGDRIVDVRVRFRSDPVGIMFGPQQYEVLCHVDVFSFAGTDASDRNWDKKGAEALKRIATTLDRASRGVRPLEVVVQVRPQLVAEDS